MEVKVELSASKQKSMIDKIMADKIITNVSFYVMNINIFYFHTYVYRVIIQLVWRDICQPFIMTYVSAAINNSIVFQDDTNKRLVQEFVDLT